MQTWVNPDTGVANNFLDSLKGISSNPEVVMLLILGVFASSHSGLAYLRPWGMPVRYSLHIHKHTMSSLCVAAYMQYHYGMNAPASMISVLGQYRAIRSSERSDYSLCQFQLSCQKRKC